MACRGDGRQIWLPFDRARLAVSTSSSSSSSRFYGSWHSWCCIAPTFRLNPSLSIKVNGRHYNTPLSHFSSPVVLKKLNNLCLPWTQSPYFNTLLTFSSSRPIFCNCVISCLSCTFSAWWKDMLNCLRRMAFITKICWMFSYDAISTCFQSLC